MASIHRAKMVGGTFATAADDAILDAAGSTAYTVSATANATVNSIQLASTALSDIKADFSVINGTGAGANVGAIRVENGATLTLQGPVTNTGTTEIFGEASATSIVIGQSGVTLDGGGEVFLNFSGGRFQQIVGASSTAVLTDVDNRISGQGCWAAGA